MANSRRVRRRGQRRAAHHRRRRVHAQQAQAFEPLGQAAVEVDVDAREAARVQARQVRDQRLRAFGVGRHHRADGVAAAEAAQHREAAGAAVVVEHHGGVGVAATARRSARRAACRAPRRPAHAASAGRLWSAGTQAPAGVQRDQRRRLGDALVLAHLAGAHEAQAFVQAAAFGGGVQQHACSRPGLPAARVIRRWPMRRPWQAGATTTRPIVACRGAPAPAQPGADDLAVALGDQAFAVAEGLFPVGGPVRPAQLVGQRVRGRAGRPRSSRAAPRHRTAGASLHPSMSFSC